MDLFGHQTPPRAFIDIRNTRPSIAEEKAQLLLRLGRLLAKCPQAVANGSIDHTRDWVKARKEAAKTAKSVRASVGELESAISSMRRFL